MNILDHTQTNLDKKLIFIVEDNETYSRSLKTFIRAHFPSINEIKSFAIGEMCVMELERNPNIIIIDYFLNSKYTEANNGFEIIERIKILKPHTNIIVLSSEENLDVLSHTIKQFDCIYILKNHTAFNKIKLTITEILDRNEPLIFEPLN